MLVEAVLALASRPSTLETAWLVPALPRRPWPGPGPVLLESEPAEEEGCACCDRRGTFDACGCCGWGCCILNTVERRLKRLKLRSALELDLR